MKSDLSIQKQASDWVIALHGNCTREELASFRAWLLRSPVHVDAYLKAETVWLALKEIDADKRIEIDRLFQSSSNIVSLPVRKITSDAQETAAALKAGHAPWGIAAGLMIFMALALTAWLNQSSGVSLRTTLGEQHTSILEDGTAVEINTQSQLRIDYSRTARRVEVIAGEAYFNVRKDPLRPFIVSVGEHEVRAIGTEFNVYKRTSDSVVTVAEGVIELAARGSAGQGPVRLRAGQQAIITGNSIVVDATSHQLDRAVAWRKNQLLSFGEPLRSVLEEINRYNQQKITLNDSRLQDRKVSGVFSVHNPELIVRFLEESSAVSVSRGPDGSWLLSDTKGEIE